MYGVDVRNWAHATLVGGECSHHWETFFASQQISAVVRHFLMKFDLILYLSHQSMSQVITYRRKGDHKSFTLIDAMGRVRNLLSSLNSMTFPSWPFQGFHDLRVSCHFWIFLKFPCFRVFLDLTQFNRHKLWCPLKSMSFNDTSLSYIVLTLTSAVSNLSDITLIFHDFPWPTIKIILFHDFPSLENEILKFNDFPGFPCAVEPCMDQKKVGMYQNAGARGLVDLFPHYPTYCLVAVLTLTKGTHHERRKLLWTTGCSQEEDSHNVLTTDI